MGQVGSSGPLACSCGGAAAPELPRAEPPSRDKELDLPAVDADKSSDARTPPWPDDTDGALLCSAPEAPALLVALEHAAALEPPAVAAQCTVDTEEQQQELGADVPAFGGRGISATSVEKAVRFATASGGTDLNEIAVSVSALESSLEASCSGGGEPRAEASEATVATVATTRSKVSRFQSWSAVFVGARRAPLGDRILPKNSQTFRRGHAVRRFWSDWLATTSPAKAFGLLLGVAAFAAVMCLEVDASYPKANDMLAIALLVSVFWVFEVLPLAATALIPVVLMPFCGITTSKVASSSYWGWVQMLFLGAFLVDIAVEHVDLHRRIALKVLLKVGVRRPWVVVAAFMTIAYFLSMWCSNTATTVMLVPFATGLVDSARLEGRGADESSSRRFAVAVLLAIAYSSSCGGMATLIGTPPNGVLAGLPMVSGQIGAIEWFRFAAPVSATVLAIAFVTLNIGFLRGVKLGLNEEVVSAAYRDLGPFSRDELLVALVQLAQFLGFLIRADVINEPDITGYPDLRGVNDATIACAAAVLLFILPSEMRPGEVLLPWEVAQERVPWGVLLLMGGGLAIAKGFEESDLTKFIGEHLASGAESFGRLGLTYALVAAVCMLTEVTSNTATANIILPMLTAVAQESLLHPLSLALPATLACSLAFMLPAATPPNAVVFATGMVRISDMVKVGFVINILGVAASGALIAFMADEVFDTSGPFPRWACAEKACAWVDRAGYVDGRQVQSQACALIGEGLCRFRDGVLFNTTAPK